MFDIDLFFILVLYKNDLHQEMRDFGIEASLIAIIGYFLICCLTAAGTKTENNGKGKL